MAQRLLCGLDVLSMSAVADSNSDISKLTKIQKLAILLIILGPETAAQILKNLGPKAKGVIPALIQALRDSDQDVVLFAAQALGRIGPDAREAAPALQEALQNGGARP